jgi:hypothetical protein
MKPADANTTTAKLILVRKMTPDAAHPDPKPGDVANRVWREQGGN